MIYELIDVESANLIGTYESEAEALAVVRAALRADGPASIEPLALGYTDDKVEGEMIADGAELAARALAADPERTSRSA